MNDDLEKLRTIADYQFGYGAGKVLFSNYARIEYSKNTGRPRHIFVDNEMVASYRPNDGVFTITIAGAKHLNDMQEFTSFVVVMDEVLEFIEQGKTLFAKHVLEAGPGIRPDDEVIIRNKNQNVVAVGKAILTSKEMTRFKYGKAVKIRRGVKRHR